MDLYGSQTYMKDLEKVADSMPFLDEMRNSSVLVTGATGLICSAVTDLLLWCNESRGAGITVYAARVLFISSSEVYGKKNTLEPFSEEEYGYVDLLNARASYPVSKRAAETLCVSYGAEYDVDIVIVRPGHIYGPTASEKDSRVSSAFAYDALKGRDLVLKSDGSQIRSYCYVLDCASAIIWTLMRGKSKEAYNISNPSSVMTIREMAEGFARAGNVSIRFEIPDSKEKSAFNPMNNSSLKSDKLQGIGWRGLFDAGSGTEHTVRIMAEASEKV